MDLNKNVVTPIENYFPDWGHPCVEAYMVSQAWYFTEAMEAIASVAPGRCLGALEMLQ